MMHYSLLYVDEDLGQTSNEPDSVQRRSSHEVIRENKTTLCYTIKRYTMCHDGSSRTIAEICFFGTVNFEKKRVKKSEQE